MRKSSFNTGGNSLGLIAFGIWGYFVICWIVNVVKLVNCDFEGPWKDEIIHAIGLIGPAAGITAWF
jgi:hypothetical protein